jgi:DNA-binding MurR/RpiR family transcriptional regulator
MESARRDLFDKIVKVYPTLSPKKRRVADFIIKDHKKIFMMTAKEIAQECQVSEPTIIRFTVDLGFSGYMEFVQYMKGLLHIELTAVERLLKTSRQPDQLTTIERYCRNAIGNLESMMNAVSEKDFKRIARALCRADTVYVVGYRASAALAYYFGYLLKKVRHNVIVDTALTWELRDLIAQNGKSGLMFVIAFPRYPRKTIELMEYAKEHHVKVIGMSDTPKSPIVSRSDQYVIIDLEAVSFVDPFAHVMAYLSALVHEVTYLDLTSSTKCLSRFDSGVRVGDEFFTEDGAGPENSKTKDSYLTSFCPPR